MDEELDLYVRAYLCGGPDRVARTAVVALCQDGRITVASEAPYRVARGDGKAVHPVESAALQGIPGSGLPLRLLLRTTAVSPAVQRCAGLLLDRKLLKRSFRGWVRPTPAGDEVGRRLSQDEPEDGEAGAFAARGLDALAEGPLSETLATLPAEAGFPIKLAHRPSGRGYDGRGDYNAPDRSGGIMGM